ncbi:hypothetical protein K443DRAFT_377181 [Laccaria amethystina LaAM-08-1]|uniref:Uncharacterized protein n=1 Tax=Laccaria amethystina LaAM-08-1 TaxID=1095629 RepID=A0A0C9X893_9AGAR|nr:hypothetical protein K443DRAFT_377181 [Laccaria amethystina LaAM-08-1]
MPVFKVRLISSKKSRSVHALHAWHAPCTPGTPISVSPKCVNQTFIFDYLTYEPSFSTLATMPNLTLPASTNGTSLHTATISTPVGAIVGGILGGLVLVFLLIGAFLWFQKRKAQDDQGESNQITIFPVLSGREENLSTFSHLGRFSQYP